MHYYLIYTNVQGTFEITAKERYCTVGPHKSRYTALKWFKQYADGRNYAKFCKIISLPKLSNDILY